MLMVSADHVLCVLVSPRRAEPPSLHILAPRSLASRTSLLPPPIDRPVSLFHNVRYLVVPAFLVILEPHTNLSSLRQLGPLSRSLIMASPILSAVARSSVRNSGFRQIRQYSTPRVSKPANMEGYSRRVAGTLGL